jgi:hypothetical protein
MSVSMQHGGGRDQLQAILEWGLTYLRLDINVERGKVVLVVIGRWRQRPRKVKKRPCIYYGSHDGR